MGNSLAAGFQPDRRTGIGDVTDDGYTDQIYQRVRGQIKNLEHIKLGCPGETSVSLTGLDVVNNPSPCATAYQTGVQLGDAVAFLAAHEGEIAFITINIGANDISQCGFADPACVQQALAVTIPTNLGYALAQLQAAAPGVPIIGLNYYNPNLYYWLEPGGPEGEFIATESTKVVLALDGVLQQTFGAFGVPVADITGAFDTADFSLRGGVPHNVRVICQLTWMCEEVSEIPDIHPNKNGYKVIARTVEQLMKELGII